MNKITGIEALTIMIKGNTIKSKNTYYKIESNVLFYKYFNMKGFEKSAQSVTEFLNGEYEIVTNIE